MLVVLLVLLVDTSARMGSAICCGESSNYLPIEERYNASHHRTYASTSGNSNTHNRDPDPLLAYSNNNKYNYYNGRTSKNNNNNNKMYSCPSCTYQHMYEFSICEMCGSSVNTNNTNVVPLTPEEIEERRQKIVSAASQRAEKQAGSAYEKKLRDKAKKLEAAEKRNKELGGENQLRWSR